jgi:hypothetical protein
LLEGLCAIPQLQQLLLERAQLLPHPTLEGSGDALHALECGLLGVALRGELRGTQLLV